MGQTGERLRDRAGAARGVGDGPARSRQVLLHAGAVLVSPGYTHPAVEAAGGNPYGTCHPRSAGDLPTPQALAAVAYQARRAALAGDLLRRTRSTPRARRISVSASRPVRSITWTASRVSRGRFSATWLATAALTTITLRLCETMSCSSLAMRRRSSASASSARRRSLRAARALHSRATRAAATVRRAPWPQSDHLRYQVRPPMCARSLAAADIGTESIVHFGPAPLGPVENWRRGRWWASPTCSAGTSCLRARPPMRGHEGGMGHARRGCRDGGPCDA